MNNDDDDDDDTNTRFASQVRRVVEALNEMFPGNGEAFEAVFEEHVFAKFADEEPYFSRWMDDRFVTAYFREYNCLAENKRLGYFPEPGAGVVLDKVSFSTMLENGTHVWGGRLWKDETTNEKKEQERLEGQFSCSNCARKGVYSRNTSHIELQTRSADESSTIFVTCHTCNRKFRICN